MDRTVVEAGADYGVTDNIFEFLRFYGEEPIINGGTPLFILAWSPAFCAPTTRCKSSLLLGTRLSGRSMMYFLCKPRYNCEISESNLRRISKSTCGSFARSSRSVPILPT